MIKEFKEFVVRGNVVDRAVGIIIINILAEGAQGTAIVRNIS
jgi:large-conductance mechanosensitive channel